MEQSRELGSRSLRLAGSLLEAGAPLPTALRQSGNPLPIEAALAVDLGEELGALGPALRRAATRIEGHESIAARCEKLLYLLVVIGVGVSVSRF